MIDAYQAAVIAYMTDGGVIHADCVPEEIRLPADLDDYETVKAYDYRLENEGYSALIRYSIHEWENSNWSDLSYSLDFEPVDWGESKNIDYSDETVLVDGEWQDVSSYIGVFCDECGLRIE